MSTSRAWRARCWRAVGALAVVGLVSIVATSVAAGAKKSPAAKIPARAGDLKLVKDLSGSAISRFEGAKSNSGRLAKSDPSLLGRTDSTPVAVMVKYDFDPVASYLGGTQGLPATSPGKTGKKLSDNKAAVAAYKAYIGSRAFSIGNSVQSTVPGAVVHKPFLTAYGGASAVVPANQIGALLKVPGVVAVQKDSLRQPLDDNTSFIGATSVWPSLGGNNLANWPDITVGVIDSGVWPEHPMMAGLGMKPWSGNVLDCDFGDGSDTAHLGNPFTCNNKLVGAYAETDTYMALVGAGAEEFCNESTGECSVRDSEGHGTHTTTTSAGQCVQNAVLFGVSRGQTCGIAPGAHVVAYRVCLAAGCYSSDSVASVEEAIADGVNVINFSISGGAQAYTDPVELAFLDAMAAGISVNASAGNSGPGSATSDHAGPWLTTVAASTGPRSFLSDLVLKADNNDTFEATGNTIMNGISTAKPIVLAQTLLDENGQPEDAKCQQPLADGAATGKIVLCMRGTNGRVSKGFNVLQGDAAGMILYNAIKQDVETDNHWLPTIHLDGPDDDLLDFIDSHTGITAKWASGSPQATQADMMAAFSSRGPVGDWLKPDVTAPGVQVFAGMTPSPDVSDPSTSSASPPGTLYQAIAGTSMSSPHSAGASALVKAAHPDWTPMEIKSALMTSSSQDVIKEDGVTDATPFDRGAGSIRVNRAVNPTLVFDETYDDFVAAGTDPLDRIDLNLASINAPTMSGWISTSRTATNVTGKSQSMKVETEAPDGAQIIVSKKAPKTGELPKALSTFSFGKGDTTFYVTISAPELANGQYFGQIRFVGKGNGINSVTIPVAFKRTQGQLQVTNSCDETDLGIKESTDCLAEVANLANQTASVNFDVSLDKGLTLNGWDGTAGTTLANGVFHWSGQLAPALPGTVNEIDDVTGQWYGYLPLSIFGVPAIADMGDDTIVNFNVPTFYWAGEAQNKIGVTSNGYVVIGGGQSEDLVYNPQDFPDPNRPNNVIAPKWSDLNPSATGAGDVYIAVLTDGGYSYLVVTWEGVKNFGDSTTHDLELWLQLQGGSAGTGSGSELPIISYGNGGAAAGDPDSGTNSGAENRDGTSGVNFSPTDHSDWYIDTGDPQAGGSAGVLYSVFAKKAGTYKTVASASSDVTRGVTRVVETLQVGT